MKAELLFVYNAASGTWNTALDMAHKVLLPKTYSCNLCQITHGVFQEKKEWTRFLEELQSKGIRCTFLHKDEFYKEHPGHSQELPALFLKENGSLDLKIDSKRMNQIGSVEEMIQLVGAIIAV